MFDRESVEPIPRTLALHEEEIGAFWNYTEWIQKQCAVGFDQNLNSHRRVSELLCQVGQCYESIKDHLPRFEQQRADWLLEQLTKMQQWMENFRAEVVREILAIEGSLSDFQKRQEQTFRVELQHSSENQLDATQLKTLQVLLQSLQDHMTVFESHLENLKFAVRTSLKEMDIKLEVAQVENAQLRSLVQSHDKQFAELMPYLTRIETRFMEIKD